MIDKTERFLMATTEDDEQYYIYNAHDLIEKVSQNPQFVMQFLENLSNATWCQAYDVCGRPIWLRTSTIVRVEYREVKIRKG